MINKEFIRENKILVVALLAYLVTAIYSPEILKEALKNTWIYIKEMLEILPAVFILTGLINAWVPRETIVRNFGREAGLKGKLISVFIGSVSAGPIYAAFPITHSLLMKGASIANVVIIISTWAVIKVPMLLVEAKFLGIGFAATRYILTVPAIILMGIMCEAVLKKENVSEEAAVREHQKARDIKTGSFEVNDTGKGIEKILKELPGYNCGSCGFESCQQYARAIVNGKVLRDRCPHL